MEEYIKKMIESSPDYMISYAHFIQAALYHPAKGYYTRNHPKIGPGGDFITTSNVSSIFGETVAKWYAKQSDMLELPAAVCEIGGGSGKFAKAFLDAWASISSKPVEYKIIETSPYHRSLQEEMLSEHEGVIIQERPGSTGSFNGLLFSNELFDALPVHVIKKKQSELFEVMVTFAGEMFKECEVPLSNPDIWLYLRKFGLELEEGQRIEIPLAMVGMIEKMAGLLNNGLMMTVDYGYTNEEWKLPSRRDGSLRGYAGHRMVKDVLQTPGCIDITSHVHFDAFIAAGEEYGLHLMDKLRQDEFFLASGLIEEIGGAAAVDPFSPAARKIRAVKSLILPGGMSSFFHVLVQGKGV